MKGNQWVFISPDHKAGYVLLAVGRYFWRGIRRARLELPFITWREPSLRISPRGTRTNGFGWMVKRMNLGWPVQKNQQNKTAWVFIDWFEIKKSSQISLPQLGQRIEKEQSSPDFLRVKLWLKYAKMGHWTSEPSLKLTYIAPENRPGQKPRRKRPSPIHFQGRDIWHVSFKEGNLLEACRKITSPESSPTLQGPRRQKKIILNRLIEWCTKNTWRWRCLLFLFVGDFLRIVLW